MDELFLKVKEVVNGYDPVGLVACTPDDEFDREIIDIMSLLKREQDNSFLLNGIRKIFIEQVGFCALTNEKGTAMVDKLISVLNQFKMTNSEKIIKKINKAGWHDWFLDEIIIDDGVIVKISLDEEIFVNFKCIDCIGIAYLGHWDESTIEDMWIESEGDVIKESKEKIMANRSDGFAFDEDVKRFNSPWLQLNIKLIDGVMIKIAFKEIEEEIIKKQA